MKRLPAVMNTDAINRQNSCVPLSGLVGSLEHHLADCQRRGLPAGMPSHISHDLCRPIGWSRGAGVYLAKDMARQVGMIDTWTTTEECDAYAPLLERYWEAHHIDRVEPYLTVLQERLAGQMTNRTAYFSAEAAVAVHDGLAAAIYPEFFDAASKWVDKDGLVDYAELCRRTRMVQPGVFHEPKRDLLLFAHRYFRRSLAHNNALNQYVLTAFHDAAVTGGVQARLRLDPDLIGHPDSAREIMELEYWRGPHFDDDIARIPSGVAVHAADDNTKFFAGVSETQIWWKDPEERRCEGGELFRVRTFEVEELIEDPSPGLPDGKYGCRYAHAEYDIERGMISHFDGAIRAYEGDAFLDRLDCAIDRSGKRSNYTKLFRLDGDIPLPTWKRVLTDHFRGNPLIPEYLGADADVSVVTDEDEQADSVGQLPTLSAYVGLALADDAGPAERGVLDDQYFEDPADPEATFAFAEIGEGALAAWVRNWNGSHILRMLSAQHSSVNLSTIMLTEGPTLGSDWIDLAKGLPAAIAAEAAAARINDIAMAVRWLFNGVETTVSIAGAADLVAQLLTDTIMIVKPGHPAKDWIEPFRDALCAVAPELARPVAWPVSTVKNGRIVFDRDDHVRFREYRREP